MDPLLIINMVNASIPGIIKLWTIIHHPDGSATIIQHLSEDSATFAADLKQSSDWFASKGRTPAQPTPPPVPVTPKV